MTATKHGSLNLKFRRHFNFNFCLQIGQFAADDKAAFEFRINFEAIYHIPGERFMSH